MTKRRNPKAPKVSISEVKRSNAEISDHELFALTYRFQELERLRKEETLNTPFIALEALGALAGGRTAGRTESQLRATWPSDWGEESITVPLALLIALKVGWENYRRAPPGATLGESLQIEAGGQGRAKMKNKLNTIDRNRKLANEAESEYLHSQITENPMSLEETYYKIAERFGVSFSTVENAHKMHRDYIRKALSDLGIL